MILKPFIDDSELANTIESLRMELLKVGTKEGLSSENTIIISQKLDYYIAKYQSIKNY